LLFQIFFQLYGLAGKISICIFISKLISFALSRGIKQARVLLSINYQWDVFQALISVFPKLITAINVRDVAVMHFLGLVKIIILAFEVILFF